MFRKTVLRNGKIPANTECPWKGNCRPAANLECRHVGINKYRDFNCPHAVSNEVIDAVGGMHLPNKEVKKETKKFKYLVTKVAETITQEQLSKNLNTAGSLGWDFCAREYSFLIFKREIV